MMSMRSISDWNDDSDDSDQYIKLEGDQETPEFNPELRQTIKQHPDDEFSKKYPMLMQGLN